METRTGQVIAQRYQLGELLGSGGQCEVYSARDLRDGDEVAVKVLLPHHADENAVERMFREAHAMTALTGSAVVRVLHQVATGDGGYALVMERLYGCDYEQYLENIEARGERMASGPLLQLFRPIVETLDRAHANGIIHRDLKPGNIFVMSDGGVKLLDFGFAKLVRSRGITAQNVVAGSPAYLAPEIWMGKVAQDQRMDVYALGVILFRSLAGRLPFEQTNAVDLMRAVAFDPRPSLHALRPDLPDMIDDWVNAALAVDPQQRFEHASALFAVLQRIIG